MRNLTALRTLFKRYCRSRDGATAVEFAILVMPFSALLFSIIELAIVFFIGSAMTHSMHDASRLIRTGEFQSRCGSAGDFKTEICNGMAGLGDCENNLKVDVVTSTTGQFSVGLLPAIPMEEDPAFPGEDRLQEPDGVYQPGANAAQAVVVIRARYYHPLILPGEMTRLSNLPQNNRLITSTTAFRNEPFPGGCSPA